VNDLRNIDARKHIAAYVRLDRDEQMDGFPDFFGFARGFNVRRFTLSTDDAASANDI
jgi:hypothetical protein